MARSGWDGQGVARQGGQGEAVVAWSVVARQVMARRSGQGLSWRGMAWLGKEGCAVRVDALAA